MSWHKKDWTKLAALVGAAAATYMTGGAASPALAAAEGIGEAGVGALGAGAATEAGGLSAAQLAALGGQSAAMEGAAGVGQGGIAASGMFAAPGAAVQAAPSAMGSAGLFAQVPGVSAGSQQAALLAAQNEGFGGAAADLTAKAAMPAVKDAYASGQMGLMDYMGNVGKADMAGMNDPSVWMSRLSSNAGRIGVNAGKSMATNAAMRMLSPQQGYQPAPAAPAPHTQGPGQIVMQDEKQQALADFQAGRISVEELKRKLGVYA